MRNDSAIAVWLAVAAFVVFNANCRLIGAGDSYPARFIPFGLWKAQTVYVDPVLTAVEQGHDGRAYWIQRTINGHYASLYPVVTPVVIAPLYAAAQHWSSRSRSRSSSSTSGRSATTASAAFRFTCRTRAISRMRGGGATHSSWPTQNGRMLRPI